jgi:trimethylguanosine synthase
VRTFRVVVSPLPRWASAKRLMGVDRVSLADDTLEGHQIATVDLPKAEAAAVMARVRGLVLGGHTVSSNCSPKLPRTLVRAARSDEARLMRKSSVGFMRDRTRAGEEGRWSLTPERIAATMAKGTKDMKVVDATCGVGGNAIAFARAGAEVVAIESNAERLSDARHNARRYRVEIRFLRGLAQDRLSEVEADLIFVDPPWAGFSREACVLTDLPPLAEVLAIAKSRRVEAWAKVPPSFDPSTVPNATVKAIFGVGEGDKHRIKFLWLKVPV